MSSSRLITPEGFEGGIFQAIFVHAGMAMIDAGLDRKIRHWNAAAGRVFGASEPAMRGVPLLSIVPQAYRPKAEDVIEGALRSNEPGEFEFQYPDPQGRFRELIATVSVPRDERGRPLGVLLCVRDLTPNVQVYRQAADTRAMVALGDMAGRMAHHFNNILGGIATSVDFALTLDDPYAHQQTLEKTAQAVNRAAALLRGLLSFAEGDHRSQDMADLTEVVIDVAGDYEKSAAKQGVGFSLTFGNLPVIEVPREQMTTVLRNLAQNALDAMPDGGELTIETRLLEGRRAVLDVRDTGRGLSEEDQRRIFEPFYHPAGSARPTPTFQTGLGLAMAFGIVQRLKGSITVTSQPDQGSCFEICLPF